MGFPTVGLSCVGAWRRWRCAHRIVCSTRRRVLSASGGNRNESTEPARVEAAMTKASSSARTTGMCKKCRRRSDPSEKSAENSTTGLQHAASASGCASRQRNSSGSVGLADCRGGSSGRRQSRRDASTEWAGGKCERAPLSRISQTCSRERHSQAVSSGHSN